MRTLILSLALSLVELVGLVGYARALPVTWEIQGQVRALTSFDDPEGPPDPAEVALAASLGVTPGTPVLALLTFEPTTPDAFGDDGFLDDYPGALLDFKAFVGSLYIGGPGYHSSPGDIDLFHGDDAGGARLLLLSLYYYDATTGFRSADLYLQTLPSAGDTYFPNDHLPLDPPPVSALTLPPTCVYCGGPASAGTNLLFDVLQGDLLINATVTGIRRLPEPAALGLVAPLLCFLVLRSRRSGSL